MVPSEPLAAALVGRTLGDKFLVRRVIGQGGMGAVYEVEHVITKRVGALKLLHPRSAAQSEVVTRFVREASAAGRIGNPHIVVTYDAGELASGEPYLFMELLEGSAISALIDARGRLPFELARELVTQAAEALAAAHVAGIVHRDVKPENLFLCSGQPPFVKVLDFGISKFAPGLDEHRQLTVDGAPMGSPYYMSPEQAFGKRDLDLRTDIYSLGVVLYECVTGEVPFRAESLSELGVKIFEGRYARASEISPELPAGVDELVAKAMAREPSERYQSMDEFRAALLALDVPTRAPHAARRRGTALALLASALLAVLALAVGVTARRRALGSNAEPMPTTPGTQSASPSREQPGASVSAANATTRPAPTRVEPTPLSRAPSSARAQRSASPARMPTVPSSRAREDGLVETNPFH